MADSRGHLAEPSGSPHDIAMMAYDIARRAMDIIEQHEKDCREWRTEQREAMDSLRTTALANFTAAAADRADFRRQINWLTGILTRVAAWVIPSMAAGLCGTVWWIITHPQH